MSQPAQKALIPIGSALDDLTAMPERIRCASGAALRFVQNGGRPAEARPFKEGLPSAVLKLVEDYDSDTYRAAYVADFPHFVYLLHVFKKKSTSGIGTPRHDLERIETRLRVAKAHMSPGTETRERNHE
jgi:phage-related protein